MRTPGGRSPKRAGNGHITLLYGSHDTERNHAIVLRDYLAKHVKHK
ncbi:DUF488 family protein [Paraburkholderia sp. BR14262]